MLIVLADNRASVHIHVLARICIMQVHIHRHTQTHALKALFTLLRSSCQILRFLAAVSDFRLPTINLCKKFICEAGDRVTHMKDAFWLAACNARPNQL